MIYLRWLLYFIPALAIEILCLLTNPIVCLFVTRSYQRDTVKRLGKRNVSIQRDNLIWLFKLWQTHDNNADEGWYGMYAIPFLSMTTQNDYDNSALIRYWCRLWWLSRNTAYGWHYFLFSRPKETAHKQYEHGIENKGFWYLLKTYKSSFQFECHAPIYINNRHLTVNIGWKSHKSTERLLYANRMIGFRKY